jgi:copper(I)-binding protein
MIPQTKLRFAAAICAAALLMSGCADGIDTSDMWARPTAPGAESAAFYGEIVNNSGDDTVVGHYYSPACGSIELHTTEMVDDVMQMRPADPDVAALDDGETLELKPRSYHLMCLDLVEPLVEGETVSLELTFEGVEVQVFDVPIEDREEDS